MNYYNIKWVSTDEVQPFVTYLYEEFWPIDIGDIAEEQKSRKMKYKQFSRKEILERRVFV